MFLNESAAVQRSCDVQKNRCANAANSGGGFAVSDCEAQQSKLYDKVQRIQLTMY
jgi:hypothetical protein